MRAHPGLCTISLSTRTASSLLMFSKFMSFTWKGGEVAQRQCGRVRSSPKPAANRSAYLQKHVSGLNTAISSHSAPLHDGADVDASVTPLITLAHDGDTQEVVLLCGGSSHEGTKAQKPWRPSSPLLSWGPSIPMLSVTVMMLRDIVESVTLLKDEVCDRDREER